MTDAEQNRTSYTFFFSLFPVEPQIHHGRRWDLPASAQINGPFALGLWHQNALRRHTCILKCQWQTLMLSHTMSLFTSERMHKCVYIDQAHSKVLQKDTSVPAEPRHRDMWLHCLQREKIILFFHTIAWFISGSCTSMQFLSFFFLQRQRDKKRTLQCTSYILTLQEKANKMK